MDANGALLPADERSLMRFATSLSDSLRHSSIKLYLIAVRSLHIDQGLPYALAKIIRDTLIGPKDRGRLDLPEFEIISKSLQTAWVKRMKNGVEDQWMSIPLFYLKNDGGPFIFDCDYDVKFLGLNNIPAFYTDFLNAWAEVRE